MFTLKKQLGFADTVGLYWVIASVALVIGVCLAIPLSQRSSRNSAAQDQRLKNQQNLAFEIHLELRTGYQTVFSAVLNLESFVLGAMRSLPNNTNLNATERVADQSFSTFVAYATALQQYINGMKSLQLQPGGVINQVFPAGSATIGLDLLYRNTTLSPSLMANIVDGSQIFVDGPRPFVQGGFGFVLRKLVYSLNTTSHSLSTWWGTVAVLAEWESFLNMSGITKQLQQPGIEFIIYNTSTNVIFYHSGITTWNASAGVVDPGFQQRSSCEAVQLPQSHSWTACIAIPQPDDAFTEDELFAVIFVGIFAPITIGIVTIIALWFRSIEYDGRDHAPKAAPLVFTRVGIHNAEKLWDLDQHSMERIREDFKRVVNESNEAVRGYLAEEMVGTSAIATRSIDAGIHFGFLVFEKFRKCQHQWEREGLLLRSANVSGAGSTSHSARSPSLSPRAEEITMRSKPFGEDDDPLAANHQNGSQNQRSHYTIKLRCVVHICQEVMIDIDVVNNTFHYEGGDIFHSLKLFSTARPGLVCLSHSTARLAKTVKDVELVNLSPVTSRGTDSFVLLVAAIDKRNKDVWESALHDAQNLALRNRSESTAVLIPNQLVGSRRRSADFSLGFGGILGPKQLLLPGVNVNATNPLALAASMSMMPTSSIGGGLQSNATMPTAVPSIEAYWTNWGTISKHVKLDTQNIMKKVFEYQSVQSSDVQKYESLKGIFAAFYLSFSTLFKPFAEVERKNIFRRLVSLFGVPPAGDVVEHLAVRCAMIVVNRRKTLEESDASDDRRSFSTAQRSDSDVDDME
jgi:sensor domain CHASE-containing protein